MATATISQQQLQQDYAAAEVATHAGPVFITTNGEPRTVLIEISEYRRVFGELNLSAGPGGKSLSELLAVPDEEYFEWEPPRLRGLLTRQEG